MGEQGGRYHDGITSFKNLFAQAPGRDFHDGDVVHIKVKNRHILHAQTRVAQERLPAGTEARTNDLMFCGAAARATSG